eukprot:4356470-Pyramimonas_sp.AAC.1
MGWQKTGRWTGRTTHHREGRLAKKAVGGKRQWHGYRPIVPAPDSMSCRQLMERMASFADNAEDNMSSLCDPGFQLMRDEEKSLGPL